MAPASLRSSSKVIALRQQVGERSQRSSALDHADEKSSMKSAAMLFVLADPPDDRGAESGCDS
jgi:hypothetical protein